MEDIENVLFAVISHEIREQLRILDENYYGRMQLRYLRDTTNPFEWSERNFYGNFSMPRLVAKDLIDELKPFDTDVYSEVPFHLKVLGTFHFYSKGCFQIAGGKNNLINLSQPTMSRTIKYISSLIENQIAPRFIKFPVSPESKLSTAQGFLEKFELENVIGIIDCTHVSIIAPPKNDPMRPARLYRNRKMYHSINVEATCNSEMIFTSVNAAYPGSTHDSGIWKSSPVRAHLISRNDDFFILGDRGYPLEPFIFTPFSDPQAPAEVRFNRRHARARNTIERAFGCLKGKFKCLSRFRTLYYAPKSAARIINACFALYNYLKTQGVPFDDIEIEENEADRDFNVEQGDLYGIALQRRENYANNM